MKWYFSKYQQQIIFAKIKQLSFERAIVFECLHIEAEGEEAFKEILKNVLLSSKCVNLNYEL